MVFVIHSRIYGEQRFMGQEGGYLRLWNARRGDYKQVCHGGGFMGSTVGLPNTLTPEAFAGICRDWWRQYMDVQREHGHPNAPKGTQ